MIIDQTVNAKKEHLDILIPDEEHSIAEFIKNKNRYHQGVSRKQDDDLILDILKIGDHCNSKNCGGHKFVKLPQNAHCVIKTKMQVTCSLINTFILLQELNFCMFYKTFKVVHSRLVYVSDA